MNDRDTENIVQQLRTLVGLRRIAGQQLADGLGLKPEEIFYAYRADRVPSSGTLEDGLQFFFHGLGCAVKLRDGSTTEIEFGPRGRYDAFDKFTICHQLGYSMAGCDSLICKLENEGLIELVDKELYERVSRSIHKGERVHWETETLASDASVADRYVVTC